MGNFTDTDTQDMIESAPVPSPMAMSGPMGMRCLILLYNEVSLGPTQPGLAQLTR